MRGRLYLRQHAGKAFGRLGFLSMQACGEGLWATRLLSTQACGEGLGANRLYLRQHAGKALGRPGFIYASMRGRLWGEQALSTPACGEGLADRLDRTTIGTPRARTGGDYRLRSETTKKRITGLGVIISYGRKRQKALGRQGFYLRQHAGKALGRLGFIYPSKQVPGMNKS